MVTTIAFCRTEGEKDRTGEILSAIEKQTKGKNEDTIESIFGRVCVEVALKLGLTVADSKDGGKVFYASSVQAI